MERRRIKCKGEEIVTEACIVGKIVKIQVKISFNGMDTWSQGRTRDYRKDLRQRNKEVAENKEDQRKMGGLPEDRHKKTRRKVDRKGQSRER